MLLKALITMLCGVGLYPALFMLAKTKRAERGELDEPSVVQTPRAHLLGGIPNSVFGTFYYPLLATAVWLGHGTAIGIGILAASGLAAGTSLVLAYSLLFVTKRSCPFCWTAHVINWALFVSCLVLFKTSILSTAGRFW